MTLLIDPPNAEGHGRLWSHLASDSSFEELHDFARTLGIPVVLDPSLAPGEWKIVHRPRIGDPCARCGKPTSLQGEEGVLLTADKAYHVFCPTPEKEN